MKLLGCGLLLLALSVHAAGQDVPRDAALAPAGPGLTPIPLPRLDALESVVANQIREAIRSVEALGADENARSVAGAYGSLARIFHAYEFFESSEASYLNALRLSPNEGAWHHLLGWLYQQTGRTEESIDRFLAARTLQPGNHAATARLGHSYLLLNRLADARAEFERLAGVLPAVARNGLGEIALRERRFADAVDHFRAVLERAPQASAVHYSLAMAYRGLGRLEEARSHLQRRGPSGIRAADPLVDTLRALVRGERGLVNLGRLAYEAGQFQEAADAFSRALGDAPDSLPARVNLGLALSQLGNAAAAVEQFEAVLRSDDGNTAAHAGLGLVLARERRDRDAVDHLRVAFEHDPTGADVQRELVAVLLRLGQTDGAIEVLETVRLIDPDTEDTLVGLSILLADRARYKDAIVRLDEANRRFPERMQTATTLARLLASSPDRSLRDGQRALALAMAVYGSIASPAHAETIALALAELGRCGEAAEWMRRAISEAERVKDAAEIARLRGETAKYEAPSCRPPGQ